MYQLSAKEVFNKPLHHLLNNGFRFALMTNKGAMVKHARYEYQLATLKKSFRGSKIVEIKSLLME